MNLESLAAVGVFTHRNFRSWCVLFREDTHQGEGERNGDTLIASDLGVFRYDGTSFTNLTSKISSTPSPA